MTAPKLERDPLQREPTPNLQERVRIFNLGTPTPMHQGTHELVNDLWKANEDMLAALQAIVDEPYTWKMRKIARYAIAAAVGDRPADATNTKPT